MQDACAEDDICQTEEMYDYQQDEAETCKPVRNKIKTHWCDHSPIFVALTVNTNFLPLFKTEKDLKTEGLQKTLGSGEGTQTGGINYFAFIRMAHLLSSVFVMHQKKAMDLEYEDPPGATSADYLSEAARVSPESTAPQF